MNICSVLGALFARNRRSALAALCGGLVIASIGVAASVTYEYDRLGRLQKATHGDGAITEYTLDAAGNRTTVTSGSPAGAPASITVPSISANGSFTISWTAPTSGPAVTAYELYEANNPGFSGESQVYTGLNLSLPVTGKPNGTYYYRVRACAVTACSLPIAGSTGVLVAIPPSTPTSITVPPTNNTGTFTISWGASTTGTVSAYELWEATNSSFSGETRVYNSTGTSTLLTRAAGTYYYHVRACNGPNCSNFTSGSPSIVVTLPPAAPATITAPPTNNTGAYQVSWASVSGTVTAYELWEANNASFTGETRIYNSNANTFFDLTGKANGVYYYRARACNTAGCSGYVTSTGTTVALPPGAPNTITVPATSTTGGYTISWTAPLTGTVTGYQLYEANNSSFTGETNIYSGASTNFGVTGKGNGSYWYRVRACNGASNCSGPTSGGPAVVALPPGQPGTLTVPPSSTNGVYTVSWGASSGTVSQYQLEQFRNDPTYTTIPVVWTSATNSVNVTVTQDGTYYYRVRACYSTSCSIYRDGGGTSVVLPPGVPTWITVPTSSISGNISLTWSAASSGTPTAYQVYEATNPSFSGEVNVFNANGTNTLLNRADGSYWYRVRACNASGCSGFVAGSNGVTVLRIPTTNGSLSVPSSALVGANYTVSWSAATGNGITYELQESTTLDFPQLPYTTTGTSVSLSKSTAGTYLYRYRACNASGCSPYVGIPSITISAAPTITLDDVAASGEMSLGTITFSYGLTSSGFVTITGSGFSNTGPARNYWLTPQLSMNQHQARATSPCLYKTGTFGTWQALGTGATPSWGVNLTPNRAVNCTITVEISAIANPSVILESATISLELSTQP